jgi:membrane-associated protease RseP (regulator of RpoE activity)
VDLTPYFVVWRTTALPDREVVDALVDPTHAADPAALVAALRERPDLHYYWSTERDGRHLIISNPRPRRAERWWLHGLLFALTLFTVTFAGAMIAGTIPYDGIWTFFAALAHPSGAFVAAWAAGLRFSLPLLAILLAHELGHYLTARAYGVDASPPYFIPVPLLPSFIGTMGAFIRLRTLLSDRRQLLDIGIGGPIAGFVLAVPILWYGLAHSHIVPADAETHGMLLAFGNDLVASLGDSPLTWLARHAVLGSAPAVLLHPAAVAGWLGLFVTMLNLLPISQLDGGHVLYAALPRLQRRIALGFWAGLVTMGAFGWRGWLMWGALVLIISRGRLGHPAVLAPERPLPRSRRVLAWAGLALFAVTFVPLPF